MDNNDAIHRSISQIIKVQSLFGLYPPDKPSVLFKVRTFTLYLVLLVFNLILTAVKIVYRENYDIAELTYPMTFFSDEVFGAIKLLPFIFNGQKLKICFGYFEQKRFEPEDEEEKRMLEDCVQFCRRLCQIYMWGVFLGLIMFTVPPLYFKALPVDVWLPYDPKANSTVFYSTYLFFSVANFYDGFASATVDPMIGSLLYHVRTQIKILKYKLENIDKLVIRDNGGTIGNEFPTVINLENAHGVLKRCVRLHNDILEFVDIFEKYFSFCIFCQLAGSMLALCFCCIGLSTVSPDNVDFFKYPVFYFVICFQIFVYCYFGTLIFEEYNGFNDAICSGPWYNYDVKVRKILMFMMENAKRPIIISAAKVFDLSLLTFMSTLKASYSLVAVLRRK